MSMKGITLDEKYEKGVLTYSKGRLLAYLAWFGKIRCLPSVPSDVIRLIGYKSYGHWHSDIRGLIFDNYIIIDKNYYRLSNKAKDLLKPLLNLKRIAIYNIVASVIILVTGFLIYALTGLFLLFLWNLLIALYLLVVNFHAVRPFHLLFKKFPRKAAGP